MTARPMRPPASASGNGMIGRGSTGDAAVTAVAERSTRDTPSGQSLPSTASTNESGLIPKA